MLAGSLTEFGLADVFSLLATTRKTGVLNLEGATTRGRVWIAEGGLCHAVSDVRRAPLAARLLHGAEANDEQAETLVAAQAEGDAAAIANALASVGLDPDRAQRLVVDQITDAVFDLSRWEDGTFAFDNREAGGATPVASATDVLNSVQQRLAEWDGVLARVPSGETVLELVTRPSNGTDSLTVQAHHWEVLTLVDGLRSIAEIIDITGQGTFVVSRLLADLVDAGLVAEVGVASVHTASERRHRTIAEAEQRLLGAAEGIVRHERPARATATSVEEPEPAPVEDALEDDAADTPVEPDAVESDYATNGSDYAANGSDYATNGSAPIDPRSLLTATYGDDAATHDDAATYDGSTEPTSHNGWDDAPDESADEPSSEPSSDPTTEPVTESAEVEEPAQPAEVPAPPADSSDQRRARELAALGIGPAPTESDDAEEPAKPLQRDTNVNADLLARLIDGVKSA